LYIRKDKTKYDYDGRIPKKRVIINLNSSKINLERKEQQNKFCTSIGHSQNKLGLKIGPSRFPFKIYLDKQCYVYMGAALWLSKYNSTEIDNDLFFLEMRPLRSKQFPRFNPLLYTIPVVFL